jgi:hypothetical protein
VSYDNSDYVDVAARIVEFRAKFPEGSLQPYLPEVYRIERITGTDKSGKDVTMTYLVYVAAAYRTPDDPRPGIGTAYEVFPGQTNFTKNSELQNAETSAWGRAIIALGAADAKKGIASSEDVRNRREEQEQVEPESNLDIINKLVAEITEATTEEQLKVAWSHIVMEHAAKRLTTDDRKELADQIISIREGLVAQDAPTARAVETVQTTLGGTLVDA